MSAAVRHQSLSPIEQEEQALKYRDRIAKANGHVNTSWDDSIGDAVAAWRAGTIDEAEAMRRIEEQKARAKAWRAMRKGRG